MYIQSASISTRPDNQDIITQQSSNTNDTPRDPLLGPVTCYICPPQQVTFASTFVG